MSEVLLLSLISAREDLVVRALQDGHESFDEVPAERTKDKGGVFIRVLARIRVAFDRARRRPPVGANGHRESSE